MHAGGSALQEEFRGSARFDVHEALGTGGMGKVYKVYDRELQTFVALKTLRGTSPGSLFRFKQEFRSLCDVAHPNLVPLYELLVIDKQWMFTMELVEGTNLMTFLRPDIITEHDADTLPAPHGTAPGRAPRSVIVDPATADVCRSVFRQLSDGVHFLHQSGKLHRDLKPSNILVTPEERVVVLDFGLVTGLDDGDSPMPTNYVLGTPGYVAPEVLRLETLGPAADWYSVGALLYEVLTGHVPDTKRSGSPINIAADVDPELAELACSLLEPDPSRRPTGEEVLERLGTAPTRLSHTTLPVDRSHFVGRTAELGHLDAALEASREALQIVFVSGPSGIGKTTLVENFAMRARESGAIVVNGRCYERESVPLKMLDSLIDSLTAQLLALDRTERMQVLPRDIMLLARLFPVLRRIGSGSDSGQDSGLRDPQEQRRRGLAALRELLCVLGARGPVALIVDDFHWSDVESAELLDEILGPANNLLVVCFRSDLATPSGAIEHLRNARIAENRGELALDVLGNDEARDLARAYLPDDAPDHDAESIVREAQGIPFFVQELVHHKRSVRSELVGATRLDKVLHGRIAELPDEARRVLEVAAVAGYPIAQSVALEAANAANGPTTLGVLRAEHMVRTEGSRGDDALVTYHDRIRTAVLDLMPADGPRKIHARIARSLELRADADPEMLTSHLMKADERGAAAVHAIRAGDHASELLAFDRGVFYYRLALALAPHERTQELALRRKLGEAFANAGHGADAADEYLRTAAGLAGDARGRLKQAAAEQLIRCGHVDRGLDTIRDLFHELGLWLPRSRFGVLLSILYRRLRIWLRGYRIGRQTNNSRLMRLVDLYQSLCFALSFNDPMRGFELHARSFLLALRLGEPFRLCRGLLNEALMLAAAGRGSDENPKLRLLLAQSERLRATVDPDPVLEGLALGSACGIAYLNGQWSKTLTLADQASGVLQERCAGMWWELAQLQIVGVSALYWLGDINEVCRRTFDCLHDAKAKGDRFKASGLRGALTNFAWLALDQPDEARRHADQARAEWREEFDLQHSYNVFAQAQIDLYRGEAPAALQRIEDSWGKTRRALLLTVQMNRINLRHVRARAALMAAETTDRRTNLKIARRDARRIHDEAMAWSTPLALLLDAGIAACRGDHDDALASLRDAELGFAAADMQLFVLVTRRRQGQLLGGSAGDELVRDADAKLTARGIKNPERVTALFAPGFGA